MKNYISTIIWMVFIIIITLIVGQAHIFWNPFYIQLDTPDNCAILIGALSVCLIFKLIFDWDRKR
jgi:hypothetical protein|nr:MAG TPA: hypothetical protein [Ackermannviridae sp.]